jgi:hypothetical protein
MGYVAALSHVKIGKRQLRLDPVEVVTSSCGASAGSSDLPSTQLIHSAGGSHNIRK